MKKAFGGKSTATVAGQLAVGVTGKTYGTLGSAFVGANPDKTTVVVRQNSSKTDEAGNRYEVTSEGLRQWGAWHAYLKGIGYNVSLMEKRDYWTVPAPWPHEFAFEATVAGDQLAADAYLAKRRRESNTEFDRSREIRRATVVNTLGYDPAHRRGATESEKTPVSSTAPPESSADLKTPAAPVGDELRKKIGMPPRKPPEVDEALDRFVEGFDVR